MRRTIAGSSSTLPMISTRGSRAPTRPASTCVVHAIGDRANTHAARSLRVRRRGARSSGSPLPDRARAASRTRRTFPRFAAFGVIASMQPYHAIDDGRWAESVIGPVRDRRRLTHFDRCSMPGRAWPSAATGSLRRRHRSKGSTPPLRGDSRRLQPRGWVPDQKITVEEALVAYTRAGAFASFDEKEKGRLRPACSPI